MKNVQYLFGQTDKPHQEFGIGKYMTLMLANDQ